ncbi:hypothetical protein JCM11641_004721 [Rhodosporidiobolus odoratus]
MSTISQYEAHAGAGDVGEGYKAPENPGAEYHKGKEGSHLAQDGKDERSIANKLAAAARDEKEESKKETHDGYAGAQGNSRGANIDAELKAEDEATLAAKGK